MKVSHIHDRDGWRMYGLTWLVDGPGFAIHLGKHSWCFAWGEWS